MPYRGRGLTVIAGLLAHACGGSTKPPSAIRAPAAEVPRLAPAELAVVTGTTGPVVRCKPGLRESLAALAERFASVDACKPALEELEKVVRTDCASLEARLDSLTKKFEICAKEYADSQKMATSTRLEFQTKLRTALSELAVTEPGRTTTEATGLAGLPFEAFALNAVTDFVVARAKAEVLGWVADEFGKVLCTEKDRDGFDVRSYFPTTCRVFLKGAKEIDADLQDFGRSLQAALQRDLRDAIGRLVNRAMTHVEPRLRVLVAFTARLVEQKTLADAAAYADGRAPCKEDRIVCAFKIGLYAIAQTEATPLDPSKPGDFIAALGKTIAGSADADLRAEWKLWQGKLEEVKRVIAAASAARDALKAALAAPSADAILDAEAALRAFVEALAGAAPLDGPLQQSLREVGSRLAVTREWLDLAIAGYQVIDGIRRGEDPAGLLVAAGRASRCRKGRDVICAVKVGLLVVDAVTSTSGWNKDELTDPAALEALVKRAAATFEVKLAGLADYTPSWVKDKLDLQAEHEIALARSVLYQVRRVADIVRSAYATDAKGEPPTREQLHEKARALLAATRSLFSLASTLTDRHAKATSSEQLAKAERLIDDLFAAWAALDDGDAGQFVVSLFAAADELGATQALPASIRRYLPLVTAIASAKDGAEMKAALEKYAAPVGGYKEKRTRPWMTSVSAFVGGAAGWEKLDDATDSKRHGQAGLFAPIGIDVACGRGHWCDGFGVMLSVLDIGNLVSIRFDDVAAPDPSFRQVFSPGLYARYNVRGPLNVGFGVAGVPELRRPETTATPPPDPAGGFKAVFFVAADVTMFPF